MKTPEILLLSGVAPGVGAVGEIILADICKIYPRNKIAFFSAEPRGYEVREDPGLQGLTVKKVLRRYEHTVRPFPGFLGDLIGGIGSRFLHQHHCKKLVDEAVTFGHNHNTKLVLAVLDATTIFSLGFIVAKRLRVPLLSLVWDDPLYLSKKNGNDELTRKLLLKQFSNTLKTSKKIAVVSEVMAVEYKEKYGANTILLRHGLDTNEMRPLKQDVKKDKFVIGLAGGMYTPDCWNALMGALDRIQWKIASKRVILRVMTNKVLLKALGAANIEFLGWRSVIETRELLSDCDIAYLPHSFDRAQYELTHFSFPTKMSIYLAAGKPVFIHCPEYSGMMPFLEKYPVGPVCHSLEKEDIIECLTKIATDEEFNKRSVEAGQRALTEQLNHAIFKKQFFELINV